jgi:AraC-like DNA-binding protein
LEGQKLHLENSFYGRLFKGEFHTIQEIESQMGHFGISIPPGPYIVLIIEFFVYESADAEMLQKSDILRVDVKKALEDMGKRIYMNDIEGNRLALLLACELDHGQTAKNAADTIIGQLRSHTSAAGELKLLVGVGGECDNLLHIPRSFTEAKHALYWRNWQPEDETIWFNELPRSDKGYDFPTDVALRLMNLAKSGNREETSELLKDLYERNFQHRRLSVQVLRLFVGELWGSIVKLSEQINVPDEHLDDYLHRSVLRENSLAELESQYKHIRETYASICEAVNERKKSHNVHLLQEVLNMIHSEYTDVNFNLSRISHTLKVSEVYLSQFFKEQEGENFSSYLERMRMNYAKELLRDTDLSISEIVGRVGYFSTNTFSKAFKRFNGINATDYRNLTK